MARADELAQTPAEKASLAALRDAAGETDGVMEGHTVRDLALEHGWDERRADLCAEACARHHSVRKQWEQGAEVECLRLADRIEVSGGLSRARLSRGQIKAVFNDVPRDGFYGGIAQVVWPNLRSRPLETARIFSR